MKFVKFLWQCEVIDEAFYARYTGEPGDIFERALLTEGAFKSHADIKVWSDLWKKIPEFSLESIDAECAKLIPEPLVRKYKILGHHQTDGVLYVSTVNPFDVHIIAALSVINLPVVLGIADVEPLVRLIERYYRQTMKATQLAKKAQNISAYEVANLVGESEYIPDEIDSSVVMLLDTILDDAMNLGASDIHIESDAEALTVRYRVSGNLLTQLVLSKELSRVLVRHILARSDANLSEFRLPQDSSFRFNYAGSDINIRVSVLFGYEGSYSIVLRLLMAAEQYKQLTQLVRNKRALKGLLNFLESMNGMLIIAGPTSSGKTTLLYNSLSHIAGAGKKILTIEDPVEAMLPGMTQIQTLPEIGLDFAAVIRSSLRQNPDVMMLGEMRDTESASMAMRAAITGVMVMSTLHTKNVISTILRLTDLGIELGIIASALKMIISTRLIRLLCATCKVPYQPEESHLKKVEQALPDSTAAHYHQPVGCDDCQHSGYRGVLGVYETLQIMPEMARALTMSDLAEFKQLVFKEIKGREFGDQGCALWCSGETSYEEVLKLIFVA